VLGNGIPTNESQGLKFVALADVLRHVPAGPDWLWEGYLARSVVTLLAGRPKAGKSTFLFALLAALTKGRPFLGRPTGRAGVALLSEERRDTLAEKARRFGLEEARTLHLLMHHEAAGRSWPQ